MASNRDSSSDSECEFLPNFVTPRDIKGFQFEPVRNEESSDSSSDESSEGGRERGQDVEAVDRLAVPLSEWCGCGHCSVDLLANRKEAVCCVEIPNARKKLKDGEFHPQINFAIIFVVTNSQRKTQAKLI